MGYADQKYHTRRLELVADSNVATATVTASNTALAFAVPWALPTFKRATKVQDVRIVIKTTSTASTAMGLAFLNGTNTFATVPIIAATQTAGMNVVGTLTNTASTAVSTQTTTFSNGSTAVSTITTTTDWTVFTAGATPTVNITGTATASANTMGAVEIFFENRELFS